MKNNMKKTLSEDGEGLLDKDIWLFIINSLTVGGSEKKTVMAANNLSVRGYEVHLVYLKDPDDLKSLVNEQVKLFNLERKSKVDWKAIQELRTYIKVNNIAKIWCVNLFSMLYGYLATLMIRRNIRRIVSINTTYFNTYKEVLEMILYAPVMSRMDRIIFGCNVQMNHWLRSYRLPKKKSLVIYNGIDVDYYQSSAVESNRNDVRSRYGIEKSDMVIGMVAKLRPEKDHACAIKSLKLMLDKDCKAKLMLVGSGEEYESLEGLVKDLGLENDVVFLGDVQDVREVLVAFDVFLLTSISETFSNAALEAMSMSLPVVLSDVGGASEMVDVGGNGYLFESGNVENLTAVLMKMMSNELRAKMACKAKSKVCMEFSFDRMVNDYIDV